MANASLTFGVDQVFDLTDQSPIGASGYIIEASSSDDGTTWGNPDAVVTSIQSQLLDGSLGKITSFENRAAEIAVRLLAVDMDGLERGEAELMAEVYRDGWNQLVWTPAGSSNPTVYDVVYGDLQFTFDDLDELRCIRNYTLTLTCLPRPRSDAPVTVASLPVQPDDPAVTVINDGSSATGWATTGRKEVRRNLCPTPSMGTNASAQITGIVAGSPYTFMARFPPTSSSGFLNVTPTGYLNVAFQSASGNVIGGSHLLSAALSSSAVTTVSGKITAPTGATRVVITTSQSNGATRILAGVMVEKANSVGSYFDGNTPGAAWIGKAGSSQSVTLTAATVAASGGSVSAGPVLGASADMTLTAAIDATTQNYVAVTGNVLFREGGTPSLANFTLTAGGVIYSPERATNDASGNFSAYFNVGDSLASMDFAATGVGISGGFTTLKIDQAFTSDAVPVIGTTRQQARRLPVSGSARTQASLRVETTEAELGANTLVYSEEPQASGFQPPLRAYRIGGPAASTSADAVSGSTNALATSQASADHWGISASTIDPSTYSLYALVSAASATTVMLSWQANGTAAGTPTVTGSRTVKLAAGYQLVAIGDIELPTARAYPGSDDTVNLYLWASAAGLTIDDAFLFNSKGHLTTIDASDASLLLLNSASITEPEATIWIGKAINSEGGSTTADTGVVYAGNRAVAWEQHEFKPPYTNVYVITPGTTKAQVSMTYSPRWGHHAGPVA